MSEGVIATRERASTWAKRLIRSLWTPVDPYDGDQVAEFATAAADRLATAQKTTATAAAAGQIQLLSTMGVRVSVRPTSPLDIRGAGATFTDGRVELDRSATRVRYRGQDPVDLDASDITTVEVLNRPARIVRYLESQGATRELAAAAALERLDALVDGNMMLAQRFAESEVINAAANLDGSPIVGMRRIIHPELSRTGTCGLCIAASDRLYTVRELLPMHANCKCTSAPVTEEFDPADELNAVDLRQLYRDAGGTSRAHLKRTRYKEDEHGELGPTLVPQRKYKPRSKGAKKASGGTAVLAEESKVEVARRQLPLFEANLAKLREQGLDEDSSQVKYHKQQIARYRERLASDQNSGPTIGSATSRTRKGMDETHTPETEAGSTGRPPTKPPTGRTAPGGAADDNWSENERAQRQTALGIETHGEDLLRHEIEFVERFLALGHQLEWIARDRETGKPTNDFIWLDNDSLIVELKSPKPRYSTIRNQIHDAVVRARAQGVAKQNFIVDLGDKLLTAKLRNQVSLYNRRNPDNTIDRLWVMSRGVLEQIDLQQ
ncbi:hypothetical protein hbim_07142 [Mycolicibacterium mageritense]|uniref:Uncharacterized protein n=2 Tax=Mycolicibacterium mageritense TaxID=53462 RepID=A0AAI8U2U1_MYCME|nr:hypothetical protein hbim_07142 [Mycolicibacterium mageritense]